MLLLLLIPLATAAAQGFRGRRRAPGNDPNPNVAYDGRLTFVRVKFEPLGGGWDLKWDHDYPRAETHFMKILDELTSVKPYLDGSNILAFATGHLPVSDRVLLGRVLNLNGRNWRAAATRKGFVIFDDFWANTGTTSSGVGAGVPGAHPVLTRPPDLRFVLRIESLDMQHPNTGTQAEFWGAYEDNDPSKRLVMIANYNNDIGDYMEWSDEGFLPISLTNEAYKLAVNYVLYAMTH
jgi:hypothetical protein